MGRKTDARRERLRGETGPGPTAYMLPPTVGYKGHDSSRKRNPAYSIGLLYDAYKWGNPQSPGPIYNLPKGMTAKGPNGDPAYTIVSRHDEKMFDRPGPGPCAYLPNINVNRRRPPAFSMSWRTRVNELGNASPGPIYLLPPCLGPKIPDKCASGEATIKGRGIEVEKLSQSPGPIYDIGSPNIIKSKGGAVTLKSRWKERKSQSLNAGPGSYNVDRASRKAYRHAPEFSLGIRHSEFAGTFLTECDKSEMGGTNEECNL